MKKVTAITLLFVTILLSSCKKENFETASFRCKIDGREFIGSKDLTTATFTSPNRMRIRSTKIKNVIKPSEPYGEIELTFTFNPNDISQPIDLSLSDKFYYGNNGGNVLRNTASSGGKVTITTFDLSTSTIKGNFSLTAFDDNNNSKQITEGGFDLKFSQ
jgi:hypothetical protein